MTNESEKTTDEKPKSGLRRAFIKGTVIAAAGSAGYLTNFNTPSQPVAPALAAPGPPGNLPYNANIKTMLLPDHAAKLTPNASKITKLDLLRLRRALNGGARNAPNLTAADINSITAAWDLREETIASLAGISKTAMNSPGTSQHAWVSFGVGEAHAQVTGGSGTTYACCCSCCPCCTAAAVTETMVA